MTQATYATFRLSIYQGEDKAYEGRHKASGLFGAAAVDISGWTILATVKAAETDASPLLEIDGDLTNPTAGGYELLIEAADSADLPVGLYPMDVWRVNSGTMTLIAKGTLTVRQPVRTP